MLRIISSSQTVKPGLIEGDGLPPISSMPAAPSLLSNGTITAGNIRTPFGLITKVSAIKFAFANWYVAYTSGAWATGVSEETISPTGQNGTPINTYITVSAALECPDGTAIPLLHNKQIFPDETVWTNLISASLDPALGTYYMRTFVKVPNAGEKWAQQYLLAGSSYNTTTTDGTLGSGALSGSPAATGLMPVAAVGIPVVRPSRCVMVLGDSIATGWHDDADGHGYIRRACDALSVPIMRTTEQGEKLQDFARPKGHVKRLALSAGCDIAYITYGVNDFQAGRTLAQVQADFISLSQACRDMGVKKIVAQTITPNTALTATQAQDRASYNDWLRAKAAGHVDAVFDVSPNR